MAGTYSYSYDGNSFNGNVSDFNLPKLHAKVVDNILSAATLFSREMGMGQPFEGQTMNWSVDVTQDTQGQFFVGLETLNSEAVVTTIPLAFAQTNFTQPVVGVLADSFANTGSGAIIDLDVFKYEKAGAQAMTKFGSAVYADGTANRPDGLGIIVDDTGTIGGQSRSTYSQLNATDTASGGTLTLAKMATLWSAVTAASLASTNPTIGVTTKAVFDLYEQLLNPTVRATYENVGFDKLGTRAMSVKRGQGAGSAEGAMGFDALSYRGLSIIRDDFATTGYLYFLNENSFGWFARNIVPDSFKSQIKKVNLGNDTAYQGVGADEMDMPSAFNGWFYQDSMVLPNQAGSIGRFYVIGQMCTWEPRRNGRLTGITGV